jgi:hypothetical protein
MLFSGVRSVGAELEIMGNFQEAFPIAMFLPIALMLL